MGKNNGTSNPKGDPKKVKDGKVTGKSGSEAKDDTYMDSEYYKEVHDEGTSYFYYDRVLRNKATTVRIYNGPKLILRGIYKDDFHIGIQNQWQTGSSSMLKMIVDTAASFVTGRDAKMGLAMADSMLDFVDQGTDGGWVQGLVNTGKELVKAGESLSNSHIFSADDYFKSFKGTSVTFPTNLTVTLMTDSYEGASDYEDVYDKLKSILSISIGSFESWAGGFVGIQAPPNGFASAFANIGEPIQGAVQVYYGNRNRGGYILDNMVISNLSFVMSKVMVRVSPPPKDANTETKNKDGKFRPLFIDVQVSFEPARMMTLEDINLALGI
jgi:hypothetical protein